MRSKIAFGCTLAIASLMGTLATRARSVPVQEPTPAAPYAPMEPMEDDPTIGGVKVRIGNGIPSGPGPEPKAFLADSAGNLELAVQYQVKLSPLYPRKGEIFRLVVQSVRTPGGGEGWEFDHEIELEPFMVEAGDHVNDVTVVKIPAPVKSERGAVRVVLESLEGEDEWDSRSVSTVRLAHQ